LKNVDDIQSAIHYEQVSSNLVLPCRVYITFSEPSHSVDLKGRSVP